MGPDCCDVQSTGMKNDNFLAWLDQEIADRHPGLYTECVHIDVACRYLLYFLYVHITRGGSQVLAFVNSSLGFGAQCSPIIMRAEAAGFKLDNLIVRNLGMLCQLLPSIAWMFSHFRRSDTALLKSLTYQKIG
jgi:hypothetical protein